MQYISKIRTIFLFACFWIAADALKKVLVDSNDFK
jgi:hypothetical protein